MSTMFEFVKGICCEHEWRDIPKSEHNQYCTLCGATCVRDAESGRILEYDRTSGYGQPRQEEPPRPERRPRREQRPRA